MRTPQRNGVQEREAGPQRSQHLNLGLPGGSVPVVQTTGACATLSRLPELTNSADPPRRSATQKLGGCCGRCRGVPYESGTATATAICSSRLRAPSGTPVPDVRGSPLPSHPLQGTSESGWRLTGRGLGFRVLPGFLCGLGPPSFPLWSLLLSHPRLDDWGPGAAPRLLWASWSDPWPDPGPLGRPCSPSRGPAWPLLLSCSPPGLLPTRIGSDLRAPHMLSPLGRAPGGSLKPSPPWNTCSLRSMAGATWGR